MGEHPAVALLASAVDDARKVAGLVAADQVWSCSSGDLITLLRVNAELSAVLESIDLSVVREADLRGLAGDDGQVSTPAWLATLLRLHPAEAKSRVKVADILSRRALSTAAALAEGKLNPGQARAIASALSGIEADASIEEFGEAEELLLREGRFLHPGQIGRVGRHLKDVLDPDGTPDRAARAWRDRELTITDLGGGRHRIRGTLTDEGAAILNAAIGPLAAPRPALDGEKDPRTAGQRRADALVDLASAGLRFGDLATTRGARPHVHITTTIDTLKGDTGHPYARTAGGEDLTIEVIRRIACDAGITPVVVNTLGEPLAVGRESRTVTPAIWAALVARDVGCVFAGCTRPASWCQAHHLRHWCDGGKTSLENGALLCDFHHDQVHHHGWQIRLGPDRHPELIPPPWIDPLQQPQRNTHWKLLRDGLKGSEPDRGP
jgi:hypothetical protein